MLCGFHCYWNAQCMIRAIIESNNIYGIAKNLTNLMSASMFWKSYNRLISIIINSDDN